MTLIEVKAASLGEMALYRAAIGSSLPRETGLIP